MPMFGVRCWCPFSKGPPLSCNQRVVVAGLVDYCIEGDMRIHVLETGCLTKAKELVMDETIIDGIGCVRGKMSEEGLDAMRSSEATACM